MTADVRSARPSDYVEIYGRTPRHRTIGVAVDDGERVLGIGGLEFQPHHIVAFLDIAQGVEPAAHKRPLLRAGRAVMAMVQKQTRDVLAFRDASQERSEGLLRHFGFEPAGTAQGREVWQWVR